MIQTSAGVMDSDDNSNLRRVFPKGLISKNALIGVFLKVKLIARGRLSVFICLIYRCDYYEFPQDVRCIRCEQKRPHSFS